MKSITRSTPGDELETIYEYDLAGRIASLRHESPGSTSRGEYQYAYDAIDRLIAKEYLPGGSASSQIDNYHYDAANQLVGAVHNSQASESYAYDENGNREGTTGAYNRLTGDGTYTYEYDDQGNLVVRTKISDGSYTEYTWDFRNRLTSVTERNSSDDITQSAEYLYDAFDRRVAKIVDGDGELGSDPLDIETYAYDGDAVLLTRDGTGAATHHYLNGPLVDQVLADDKHTTDGGAAEVRWLVLSVKMRTFELR